MPGTLPCFADVNCINVGSERLTSRGKRTHSDVLRRFACPGVRNHVSLPTSHDKIKVGARK